MSESRLLTGLSLMGISAGDLPSLLQLSVHSRQTAFAVDMRSEAVVVRVPRGSVGGGHTSIIVLYRNTCMILIM